MKSGKRFTAFSLGLLAVMVFVLSACVTERLQISLKESYPNCYVGEQYDITNLIEAEEGITYSAAAYQLNNNQKTQLDCSGNKFTPETAGSVYIKIRGQKDRLVGYSDEIELFVLERTNGGEESADDLAENPLLYSIATDNYGVESTLQLQTEVSLHGQALKTTIPDRTQYTTGYGSNYNVWSWLCIPLDDIYETPSVDLTEKYLSFCVKFSNASERLSFILEDKNGTFSQEKEITVGSGSNSAFSYCKQLSNGWYQIYIRFLAVGGDTFSQRTYESGTNYDVTQCKTILLTTSNSGKNTQNAAHIYFDKTYLVDEISDGAVVFSNAEIYLPNPHEAAETDILFIGNSFIYSSDVGATLQSIADENNRPLHIESYSKGNGTAPELYNIALTQYENLRQNT